MRALAALIVACLLATAAAVSAAGNNDARLDTLYAKLKSADDAEAKNVEAEIRRLWSDAGDEELAGMMALGVRSLGAGAYIDAITAFSAVIYRAPEFAEAYSQRATAQYLIRNYPDAVADLERALALEPRHFGALVGLGVVRLAMDDKAAALQAFERALAINPHMERTRERVAELRAEK